MKKVTLAFWAVIMVSGCAPVPHWQYNSPHVFGAVINGEAPVSDAEIFIVGGGHYGIPLGERPDCPMDRDKDAITNDEGKFNVKPDRQLDISLVSIYGLMGTPRAPIYGICINVNNNKYIDYVQVDLSSPYDVELKCDIGTDKDICKVIR